MTKERLITVLRAVKDHNNAPSVNHLGANGVTLEELDWLCYENYIDDHGELTEQATKNYPQIFGKL